MSRIERPSGGVRGGVIEVNPASGAETVIAARQDYMSGPAGIIYLNGFLYVVCSGTAGFGTTNINQKPPDLIKIVPNASDMDIAAGMNQTLEYGSFTNPTGLTTDGTGNIYVVDTGATPLRPGGQPQIWHFQVANSSTGDLSGPTALLTGINLLQNPVEIGRAHV